MKILITNDDGIDSPGLAALDDVLGARHELWFFAPDRERSGQSHAITLRGPIRVKSREERWFSCDGTPADCINIALKGNFVPVPDLVISGINLGPNLGTDTVYSGTVAGARQGAFQGIPSLSLSSASLRGPWDVTGAALWLSSRLDQLVSVLAPGQFLNLNFPSPLASEATGAWSGLCRRTYNDRVEKFLAPGKEHFCFLRGELGQDPPERGTDWHAVLSGSVSLTLMTAQPAALSQPVLEVW